jgi:trans-2,3-dihydro-3-hydroxyanthranilate isomerase
LRRAVPSRSGYDKALPLDGARAVYSYVRPLAGSPSEPGSEIQARNFSPRLTEDPATGSATAAAAAMLAETSDPSDGALIFRFAQGVDMGRPSLLVARVLKHAGAASAVHVGGRCINVMRGSFCLSEAT